ncbi:MAG TPA: LamG-like jellyroll fold domain-containing protein [Verrucomicrobiae bacterium]|nr:LamG-like jellyroll fold domain-containing protein [Verrucomicrobiae bacterium]
MKIKLATIVMGLCLALNAPAQLVHRYSFNDAPGSMTATDSVGGLSWSATLNGSASLDGTQLNLDGSFGTFAELPAGVISNANAVTIETWASFGTQIADWARLFDFGSTNGTGSVVDDFRLVPRAPGNYVDLFLGVGPSAGADANHPQGLDNQTNVHVVVVVDPAAGVLKAYTNGVAITGPPSAAVPSLSGFTDQLSYIGRSFYAPDPYVVASVDEFRIWNQALSPAAIEADFEAGPNNVSTNPGALKSIQISLAQPVLSIGLSESAVLNGVYAGLTNPVNLTGSAGISFTSGDTNIFTVSGSGLVQAVGAGTTSLRATFQGLSTTQSVTIAQNYLAPSHRYSFNDPPGSTNAVDSIGGPAWNGVLFGNASISGGQLVLDGSDGTYMNLPAGIVGNGKAVTVEAWASFGTQIRDWSRVFSFGSIDSANNVTEQFRLSPRAGGNWVDLNYLGADANHPQGWDNVTNLHIVAVANPPSGFIGIYANGVLIGQNSNATTPLSSAADQLSYVGKSLYSADPYLVGSIDEFRIYDGALSPDRIAIDTAAGPNTLVTNAGTLQAAQLLLVTNQLHLGESVHATFSGNFANVSNVDLFLYGVPSVSSTDTNIVKIDSTGKIVAMATGTATVTAKFGSFQSTQTITVGPATLTHRYSFNDTTNSTSAADSVGGSAWNGTLNGDATLNGTNLVLGGVNGYVQLPPSIITGYSAVSIEAWVSLGANSKWARLWDFGDQNSSGNGNSSLYFTPHNGADGSQITMFKPGFGTDATVSTNLDNVSEMQIVGVYSGNSMDLYYNGVLVGSNTPVNIAVPDIIDTNNFIGKSMFNADPYITGAVDEFRIYKGALTPGQISSDFAAGPNVIATPAPSLAIKLASGKVNISWPSGGRYVLATAANVTGPWTPSSLSTTNQNGMNIATDTPTTGAKFYRLQVGP